MEHPIVFFDGECNLCCGAVQFIIKRDKKDVYRFASLQSDYAEEALAPFNIDAHALRTFILVKNGRVYTHSTGALMVTKQLSGAWPLLAGFLIVPKFIRDWVYNFVSTHRYKWFGKRNSCWLPTPKLMEKFVG